jgi:hypothetical protein
MSSGTIPQLPGSATMPLRQFLAAAAASTVLTSCAGAPPVASGPQPESEQRVTVYPAMKLWKGTLNPTQSYQATAVASRRQNAYGNVELSVSASNPMLTHVTLTISVPNEPGLDILGWGLSQGRCGSGNPPVLSPSTFPTIQVSTNGTGKVEANIPFVMPETGGYHVNVYRGSGTQLSNVMTCAELRRQS